MIDLKVENPGEFKTDIFYQFCHLIRLKNKSCSNMFCYFLINFEKQNALINVKIFTKLIQLVDMSSVSGLNLELNFCVHCHKKKNFI